MRDSYLEVTFRHGRAIAAYLYLPHAGEGRSARSRRVESGLVIDFGPAGQPIGIEITAPEKLSLAAIKRPRGAGARSARLGRRGSLERGVANECGHI